MAMEVKDTEPDPLLLTMPASDSESKLVGMLFERVTKLYPEWDMGDRTDLAMNMLTVVKTWAHQNELTNPPRAEYEFDKGGHPFSERVREYNTE